MEFWDIAPERLRRKVGAQVVVVVDSNLKKKEVIGRIASVEGSVANGFQPLYTVVFPDGHKAELLGEQLDSRRRSGHERLGSRVRLHDARVPGR